MQLSKIPPQLESVNESSTDDQTMDERHNGFGTNGTSLTQEELDMLYEEPEMMTTNAMRAVSGHDPTDDRRLCPHYDPKTGTYTK